LPLPGVGGDVQHPAQLRADVVEFGPQPRPFGRHLVRTLEVQAGGRHPVQLLGREGGPIDLVVEVLRVQWWFRQRPRQTDDGRQDFGNLGDGHVVLVVHDRLPLVCRPIESRRPAASSSSSVTNPAARDTMSDTFSNCARNRSSTGMAASVPPEAAPRSRSPITCATMLSPKRSDRSMPSALAWVINVSTRERTADNSSNRRCAASRSSRNCPVRTRAPTASSSRETGTNDASAPDKAEPGAFDGKGTSVTVHPRLSGAVGTISAAHAPTLCGHCTERGTRIRVDARTLPFRTPVVNADGRRTRPTRAATPRQRPRGRRRNGDSLPDTAPRWSRPSPWPPPPSAAPPPPGWPRPRCRRTTPATDWSTSRRCSPGRAARARPDC